MAIGPQLIGINPNVGGVLEDGQVLGIAPLELTFRFDEQQVLDPTTLNGIRITRSGRDGVFGDAQDEVIQPGYIALSDRPHDVVVRFAETLPDDVYRIDIFGSGSTPLRNNLGQPFNDGEDFDLEFQLDLGAQVVAVVPQPVTRVPGGTGLQQARNQIVVYFNDDDLDPVTAQNPAFYQLLFTGDTATNTDDERILPTAVEYDSAADRVVLTFATALDALPTGPGTYRLRIGNDESLPLPPLNTTVSVDPGSSFAAALDLGPLGARARLLSSRIEPQTYALEFPGAQDEPGHRDVPVAGENHLGDDSADPVPGISTIAYVFRDIYGQDPLGNDLHNLITEAQKQRAREIFDLYGKQIGAQFFETDEANLAALVAEEIPFFVIVTGDLRAIDPGIPTGPGGVAGLAGVVLDLDLGPVPTAIMDNAEQWDDAFGGNWFTVAMHETGHLLGLGHTYDLPPGTIMGSFEDGNFDLEAEPVFPGDHDIVHARHLYRPESIDLDIYRFELDDTGLFTAETIAERSPQASQLDTTLWLYREDEEGGRELIARNDDYFSKDSFIEISLGPGRYYAAVAASANSLLDPTIQDSALGGTTQGAYDLRLNFRPQVDQTIVDVTGTALDGDGDGLAGGVFNYWFRVQEPAHTLLVDKAAAAGGTGSLAQPFNNIATALGAARPGDVVRIVGNGGADRDQATLGDNLAYEIGFNALGQPLGDGSTMNVPQGVTVMIDAGAIFKLRRARIGVGSSSPAIDRSGGALQVLGTPTTSVYFTSYGDQAIGVDNDPLPTLPLPGDWGGIAFRNDVDRAEGRFDYEQEGIFLNFVSHADMRYGGGKVVIDSVEQTVTPLQMDEARPTIWFNTITSSADAALSADPNSFLETNFNAPEFQAVPFTADYTRIGPDIHGNRLLDNTINGLFLRIRTPAGNDLRPLTVAGRWDDTDIVHVVSENLLIQGRPGGPVRAAGATDLTGRLDARLAIDPAIVVKLDGARIEATFGGQLIAEGVDGLPVVFTSLSDDRYGAGGTFDTGNAQGSAVAAAGSWGGLFIAHTASVSLDHARVAYGGGITRIEGTFAGFNALEIHQAEARITNSTFEFNGTGTGGQAPVDRFGRGENAEATVFVRGAQPVIVNNVVRDGLGAAFSINVNALNHFLVSDLGRSTGPSNRITSFQENHGPLIRSNRLGGNDTNGLVVRPGTLTTESVWDDTDIVHVVLDEIIVPDFHTYGGLRLKSSPTASLVVKLEGANAGLTATGRPLEIDDRIGGILQILGQPNFPVVLTSLDDDTVGAGFDPLGNPQNDTNGDGAGPPVDPGNGGGDPPPGTGPLTVTSTTTDANALRDAILGPGITPVGNAAFVGGSVSAGLFTGGSTSLGIEAGILLTTGDATDAEAPNVDSATSGMASGSGDADLDDLFGVTTEDTTSLEFSFTSDGGDLFFNFVFASEEYNEFANSIFNDVFAFFIDGENIALVPGTTLPISVNTINGGSPLGTDPQNAQYYNNNDPDDNGQFLTELGYDGFTNVFTATRLGLGAGTHTIKLAISDVGDSSFDAAVFIQANSFSDQPVQPTPGGTAGAWRSVRLAEDSHDRNVEVVTEREAPDVRAPGTNALPSTAQFLGTLAPGEKAGDENRRLGFTVHGVLSEPGDVDVFSFDANAGGEVWLDIDRTTHRLDAVVELVDANGVMIARSDNSSAELEGRDLLGGTGNLLQKSTFGQKDFWTTNPRDAGMRVVLPGGAGTTNTYHVRVRSSSPDLNGSLQGGLTSGVFELQIRLRELDERAGSIIQFADIRNATNGIEIFGQPAHSPLQGEAAEDSTANDTRDSAQPLGNLLTSDRAAVSLAGTLTAAADIDWYEFQVQFDAIQQIPGVSDAGTQFMPFVFDMDYADGLARANTTVSVFDSTGRLVYTSFDADIADDRPGPLDGNGLTDLSKGSVGLLDPFLGTVMLREGTYFVAISSVARVPNTVPNDLLARREPIDSIERIAEERISFRGGSNIAQGPTAPVLFGQNYSLVPRNGDRMIDGETFTVRNAAGESVRYEFDLDGLVRTGNVAVEVDPVMDDSAAVAGKISAAITANGPTGVTATVGGTEGDEVVLAGAAGVNRDPAPGTSQLALYLAQPSIVPFHLGDVVLFGSRDSAFNQSQLVMLDPFTGTREVTIGTFAVNVEDIAMRPDGQLFGYSVPEANANDGNSGNFHQINPGGLNLNALSTNLGDDGIETFIEDPQNPGTAIASDDGIQFDALGFIEIDEQLHGFAVGHRGAANPNGITDRRNLLYEFRTDTGAAFSNTPPGDRQGDDRIQGAGTQIVERGALQTTIDAIGLSNNALTAVEATLVAAGPTGTQSLITDGLRFSINDGQGNTLNFEFNSGPEVLFQHNPAGTQVVRDGDTFFLDGVAYEFDTGSVIVVTALNGNGITDGDRFTITDNQNPIVTRTFEFDDGTGPPLGSGNVRVGFDAGMNQAGLIAAITNAINAVANFNIQAVARPNTNRISLLNESLTIGATTASTGIAIQGAPGGNGILIRVEETSSSEEFGQAIDAAINGTPDASVDGDRLNFVGAVTANFTQIVNRGVFTVVVPDGNFTPGTIPVSFGAADTAPQVAARIAAAINGGSNVVATVANRSVVLQGGATFASADEPLQIGGTAPGGDITGLAAIDGQLYAVTNTGGLFRVFGPNTNGAFLDYVETATDLLAGEVDGAGNPTGNPIQFTGLAAGPPNVEGGRYAQTLFGIDTGGRLYAFDLAGALQPIFFDGTSSAATGLTGMQGIAFSTLDSNLWHVTANRRGDAGHGVEAAPDGARGTESDAGNSSLYFGREGNFDYDFPGGAHGSVETNSFSLAGYTANDQPSLYFTYFIDTEQAQSSANPPPFMRDAIRVFISNESGQWDLLATNNSFRGGGGTDDEFDYGPLAVQELFDNTGWRQAKIDLGPYVGQENLRLRFDFSTAGSLNIGDALTAGDELRAIDAAELRDGDSFTIQDAIRFTSNTFEFDLGFTLVTPTGAAIADGETFTVSDGVGQVVTFEMDIGDGVATGNVAVPLDNAQSAGQVARAIEDAIGAEFSAGTVIPHRTDNRVNLEGAASVLQSTQPALDLEGQPGTLGIRVPVHAEMSDQEVAQRMREALAPVIANNQLDVIKGFNDVVRIIGHEVTDQGPLGLTVTDLFLLPENGLDGDTFGAFNRPERAQRNDFEGIYLDDIVIGFAKRGEMWTGVTADDTHVAASASNQIVVGSYQLEIRRAAEYGEASGGQPPLTLTRTFDVNDRLTQSVTLLAPPGLDIPDGRTFTLIGTRPVTFEYNDTTLGNGVQAGHVAVPFTPTSTAAEVANAIAAAVNTPSVRTQLGLTATSIATSHRVELFGVVIVDDITSRVPTPLTEPGDTLTTALNFGLGTDGVVQFRGAGEIGDNPSVGPGLDVELIRLDLTAGTRVTIDVDANETGSLLDGLLRLFDAAGNELVVSDDDTAVGEQASLDPYLDFTAPSGGTYFVGISGFANSSYNPAVQGSGVSGSTGPYTVIIGVGTGLAGGITSQVLDEHGDPNRFRDQGQIIVRDSRITNSSEFGIVVDAGARQEPDSSPRPGPVRVTREVNASRLTRGVTIMNNIVAYGGEGGIHFNGDAGGAGLPAASVPFGRIVNNTIVGGAPTVLPPVELDLDLDFTLLTGEVGGSPAGTVVYRAQLSPSDTVTLLKTLTISDNGSGLGGSTGRFSGFDLDAIKLATTSVDTAAAAVALAGLNVFDFTASGAVLTAGAQRPPVDQAGLFGTVGGSVNNAVATLGAFDANSTTTAAANGFVSLGDGGRVTFNLTQVLDLTTPLYVYIGEANDTGLPTGPEVDNGTQIDNDVPVNVPGSFSYQPSPGGEEITSGVTVQGQTDLFQDQDFIFDFINYVDVGSNGGALNLGSTTVTQQPTLVAPDLVASEGTFQGANGLVQWRLETWFENGIPTLFNKVTFTSANPLGNLRFVSYLDEDVFSVSDDLLYLVGTPGQADFRAFTLDDAERVGFSHGGVYLAGPDLVNATYDGFAADEFSELRTAIAGPGTTYAINGNIDTTSLPALNDPQLGQVYGLEDVTTAFAWTVNSTATTATITSFLELIAEDPAVGRESPIGSYRASEPQGESMPAGVGILVENNASPTILNNIVASFATGIQVDTSSSSTVIGGSVYQNNTANSTAGLGDFPIVLAADDPLFVNEAGGNFYPAAGSRAIDSSVNSLQDRPALVTVINPLGIPVSPILAPSTDISGQLRVDDPAVDTPTGLGEVVFKDRGALDRADFVGPTALLITPRDNDAEGNDLNPAQTVVQINDTPLAAFQIQLVDGIQEGDATGGIGVDALTVLSSAVRVTQDGVPLVDRIDYRFTYDTTNDIIQLTSLAGVWPPGRVYTITLDNSQVAGMLDLAGNRLRPNQPFGETRFIILLGAQDQDFGDAPDPPYPTLLINNGPSHVVLEGFHLGATVSAEPDGQPTSAADGDDDDGVVFLSSLKPGQATSVQVTASADGLLDAWLDFNGDGDFSDAGDQIFFSQPLVAGANDLMFTIPEITPLGTTFARFRFSSLGGLSPIGLAPDGEVEDYRVEVISARPWTNLDNPLDVNRDGSVAPIDALLVINELNNRVVSDPVTGLLDDPPVPPNAPPNVPPGYVDVIPDGFAVPMDALEVINFLNARAQQVRSASPVGGGQAEPPGEGEPVPELTAADLLTTHVVHLAAAGPLEPATETDSTWAMTGDAQDSPEDAAVAGVVQLRDPPGAGPLPSSGRVLRDLPGRAVHDAAGPATSDAQVASTSRGALVNLRRLARLPAHSVRTALAEMYAAGPRLEEALEEIAGELSRVRPQAADDTLWQGDWMEDLVATLKKQDRA